MVCDPTFNGHLSSPLAGTGYTAVAVTWHHVSVYGVAEERQTAFDLLILCVYVIQ